MQFKRRAVGVHGRDVHAASHVVDMEAVGDQLRLLRLDERDNPVDRFLELVDAAQVDLGMIHVDNDVGGVGFGRSAHERTLRLSTGMRRVSHGRTSPGSGRAKPPSIAA